MATAAPEDAALRRVFRVTLDAARTDTGAGEPAHFLAELAEVRERAASQLRLPWQPRLCARAIGYSSSGLVHEQELAAELGAGEGQPHEMRKDNLERVLMARLMQPPAEAPWPVFYLIGCYSRASDVIRESASARDRAAQARIQDALVFAKELAVSYAGLMLGMDMFPQVRPDRYMEAWHTLPAAVNVALWRLPAIPDNCIDERLLLCRCMHTAAAFSWQHTPIT